MLLRQFRYNWELYIAIPLLPSLCGLEIYATLSALPPQLNPSPSEHHE